MQSNRDSHRRAAFHYFTFETFVQLCKNSSDVELCCCGIAKSEENVRLKDAYYTSALHLCILPVWAAGLFLSGITKGSICQSARFVTLLLSPGTNVF